MSEDTEEIVTPKWWQKNIIQTIVVFFGLVSTIVGVTFAADERWAKNEVMVAQFEEVTNYWTSAQTRIDGVETDLKIKIQNDEKLQTRSRVFELQDKVAAAKTAALREEYRRQLRQAEADLDEQSADLERLIQARARIAAPQSILTPAPAAAPSILMTSPP